MVALVTFLHLRHLLTQLLHKSRTGSHGDHLNPSTRDIEYFFDSTRTERLAEAL